MALMNKQLVTVLATFFYLGKAPKAPGTFGALGAIPVILILSPFPWLYMLAAFLLLILGLFVAQSYEMVYGEHDSKEIVIDEVVGMIIAMTWLPISWFSLALAFGLFRFFDILKPYPISYLDKKIKGGLGVMADDVAAGIVTNIILQVIYTKTTWLGHQLVMG